jgi:hypothetical protein
VSSFANAQVFEFVDRLTNSDTTGNRLVALFMFFVCLVRIDQKPKKNVLK